MSDNIEIVSWDDFKSFVSDRSLSIQYIDMNGLYLMHAIDGPFHLKCILNKALNLEEVIDFETNFKSSGNRKFEHRAADGRAIIRAESRPVNSISYFTMRGDSQDNIGDGKAIHWDFSNSDDIVTDSITTPIPEGYKRKRLCLSFVDEIWIKEGTLYFDSAPHGCYIDMWVICPTGGYYLDREGIPHQATQDTPIAHYVNHHRVFSTCQMGDELNTEAANETSIPSGYIVCIEITTPNSDTTSKGNGEIELYRIRTCLLPGEDL